MTEEKKEPTQEEKLNKVEAATFDWSSFLSTPTGKVIGGMIVALLMLASSWISDRTKPTLPPQQPPIINVVPSGPEQPSGLPPIVVPTAATHKVTLHLTSASKAIPSELPKGLVVQVDPKLYPDNAYYPWQGKQVALPCMVHHQNGTVMDVQTFSKADEVAAFVKKVLP